MLKVLPVESAADRKRFAFYPYEKYKNDSRWVLPLKTDALERFREEANPFLEHADMQLFLAKQDDYVVGRVAVIDDHLHNNTHHENLLFFGFFEADDKKVALALMEAVKDSARKLGRGRIRGPVNPSMNEGAGLQVDAFDSKPYIMTSQNPEEYNAFIEEAGYSKIKDLFSWQLTHTQFSDEHTLDAEYSIRTLLQNNYDADLHTLFDFYNESRDERHETWGQIPLTNSEVTSLAGSFKDFIDAGMVLFAYQGDELAGVAFGLPNENDALAKLEGGKVFPMGWWQLLTKKQHINSIRLCLLEVSPKHKGKGLELALLKTFCEKAKASYQEIEFSWTLEDDSELNGLLESVNAQHSKTYRLYQKNLIEKFPR